jgi:hypothetical protein
VAARERQLQLDLGLGIRFIGSVRSAFSVLQKIGFQKLKTDRCLEKAKTDTENVSCTEQHRNSLQADGSLLGCCARDARLLARGSLLAHAPAALAARVPRARSPTVGRAPAPAAARVQRKRRVRGHSRTGARRCLCGWKLISSTVRSSDGNRRLRGEKEDE